MYYIGVNFNATVLTAGVVSKDGNIVSKLTAPTLKYRKPEIILKDVAELCLKVVKEANLDMEEDIEYIGIASAGIVDKETGYIIYSSNLIDKEVHVRAEIQKYINKPVYVENDANCYALAESMFGGAKGYKNSVTIIIGRNIGGGIIVDDNIYRGAFYGSGEVGHQVIVFEGEKCKCGRSGCWEAYASATALVRDARIEVVRHPESEMYSMINGDLRLMSYEVPFAAAKKGDIWAKYLVNEYIKYVAVGLINIINILQPEVIVIGGMLEQQGEELINDIAGIVYNKIYGNHVKSITKICRAKLDYDAVIIGAALIGK